jgi:hypothetical protein
MADRFQLAVKFIHDIQTELERSIGEKKVCPQTFAELIQHVGELSGALTFNKRDPALVGVDEIYQEAVRVAVAALRLATEGDSAFPYSPYEVAVNAD